MKNPVKINIVAFNTPYPPDFGGSIDVFYKLKSLAEQGIRIILHCYTYKTFRPQSELEQFCEKVFYYPRQKGLLHFFSCIPYIVSTRRSRKLLQNLKESGVPVLFEGLHTCGWLRHDNLAGQVKIVRMHNVEYRYYQELSRVTTHPVKKLFYFTEYLKLKQYEKIISAANCIAAISASDQEYFKSRHPDSVLIPAFHQFSEITSRTGIGSYFLYHGNLEVEENQEVVEFLVNKVFRGIDIQLVIAGKNPPLRIKRFQMENPGITIMANPSGIEMDRLISEAQGCIIPTFQATGQKLKLLSSLYAGRFCIVNNKMVSGTGLENLCITGETPEEFRTILKKFRNLPFSGAEIARRERFLFKLFSNRINAEILIKKIESLQV